MWIAALIVGALLSLAFAASGGAKLAGVPAMRESAGKLGFSFPVYRIIGVLEVLGAVGLLIGLWRTQPEAARLGLVAGTGLLILMLGAVGSHLRAGDKQWPPALVLGLLAAAYVGLLGASA